MSYRGRVKSVSPRSLCPPKTLAGPPRIVAEATGAELKAFLPGPYARQKHWRVRHALWRKLQGQVFLRAVTLREI